ncbi:hypothetical protein Tco_0889274 [Tanacetum coccineum]
MPPSLLSSMPITISLFARILGVCDWTVCDDGEFRCFMAVVVLKRWGWWLRRRVQKIQPSGKHVFGDMQLFRWTLLRLILGLDVKDTGDVQSLALAQAPAKYSPTNLCENQNPNFVTPYHNMKSSTDKKKEIGSSSLRREIRKKLR